MMVQDDAAMKVGLRVKTALPMETIEDWLEANCMEPFQVQFDGFTEDRSKKDVMVYFASESDKDRFKDAYRRQEIC